MTYQGHDAADRPLDVDSMVTEDCDKTSMRTNRRNLNIRSIVAHDPFDLLEPLGKKPIKLAGQNSGVAGNYKLTLRVERY